MILRSKENETKQPKELSLSFEWNWCQCIAIIIHHIKSQILFRTESYSHSHPQFFQSYFITIFQHIKSQKSTPIEIIITFSDSVTSLSLTKLKFQQTTKQENSNIACTRNNKTVHSGSLETKPNSTKASTLPQPRWRNNWNIKIEDNSLKRIQKLLKKIRSSKRLQKIQQKTSILSQVAKTKCKSNDYKLNKKI